jgi:glycosyltransferase involved in cell wall biosynthesis
VVGDGPLRGKVPDALGFVPREELGRLYGRAAVVVCPSRREGFGLTCAEAMAHGRPVVASAVGGLTELVEHEVTGLLVPPQDPVALRAAIDRLLADSDLRARLGAEGRMRVARTCGWEQTIDDTLETYERALRPHGRG